MTEKNRTIPGLVDYAIDWWTTSFKKRPIITVAATIATLLFGALGVYSDLQEQRKMEQETESFDYAKQIKELDQVESSLRRLAQFVASQRRAVEQTEELLDEARRQQEQRLAEAESQIEELQNERQRLRPLLDADRQIVKSVFALQRQQREAEVWRQRWWGFGLGVAASICAGIVLNITGRLIARRRRGF